MGAMSRLGLCMVLAWLIAAPSLAAGLSLVPRPAHLVEGGGQWRPRSHLVIRIPPHDAEARRDARYLADRLVAACGARARIRTHGRADIRLQRTTSLAGTETYRLRVSPNGVVLTAQGDAGLFYSVVTLDQLLRVSPSGQLSAPAVSVDDGPRFGWRGVMLDSARHYQSPAWICRFIDEIARRKINILHWHLTDDQAWRLEIRKYPRLTEIGGWRIEAGADPTRRIGGIYTQSDVRQIVAYAQARHVTIVPEIEMPGHATAAIAAYPRLGAGAAPPGPSSDWGVLSSLYNVDETTVDFLEDVLTEVMALFPGPFIHVGGDEAVKDEWRASPQVQARMKALGITSEEGLQSWLIERIGAFLAAHGRRAIGWDEILEGGLPPSAAVMSWRGVARGLEAARAGHDAVLSPVLPLYFDYRQGDGPSEGPGRGVFPLRLVHDFDPLPASVSPEEAKHILGLQANIWTEFMTTEAEVEQTAFPRLSAVAEIGWTPADRRSWPDFLARLPDEIARYRKDGVTVSDAALMIRDRETTDLAHQAVTVELFRQTDLGHIHMTLDGSPPGPSAPVYGGPFSVRLPARLRAVAYDGDRPVSPELDSAVTRDSTLNRDSQSLKLCTTLLAFNIDAVAPGGPQTNPVPARVMVDARNPCWIWSGVELDDVTGLKAMVRKLPFNFQIGADRGTIELRPDLTAGGDMLVSLDRCDAPPALDVPLGGLQRSGPAVVAAAFPATTGRHDLCIRFTRPTVDPYWALMSVRLTHTTDGRPR